MRVLASALIGVIRTQYHISTDVLTVSRVCSRTYYELQEVYNKLCHIVRERLGPWCQTNYHYGKSSTCKLSAGPS